MNSYPKRLIEEDLPIARISAHARRERLVKKGRLKHLHMWWAERPLAACRAIVCATLWPDPEDLTSWLRLAENDGSQGPMGPEVRAPLGCRPSEGILVRPSRFLNQARKCLLEWANRHAGHKGVSQDSFARLVAIQKRPELLDDPLELRRALLDFIADFTSWDNSNEAIFLGLSRALTQAAHESLGGDPGTRPLVIDPFAGRGSIPLEALRVGADAFASVLNPVAVLLNTVALDLVPRLGERLLKAVDKWGEWIRGAAADRLSRFSPTDGSTGARPIAYLWARTLRCEGPACGLEIPLLSRQQITKHHNPPIRTILKRNQGGFDIQISPAAPDQSIPEGTARGGKVTCPAYHHTMEAKRYREVFRERKLGERLYAVVLRDAVGRTRSYHAPNAKELAAFAEAQAELGRVDPPWATAYSIVPDEPLSEDEPRRLNVRQYGFVRWGELFNDRQKLSIVTFGALISEARTNMIDSGGERELLDAVSIVLSLVVSTCIHYQTNMSTYLSDGMVSAFIQSSSIPMRADYAEVNPLMSDLVGGFGYQLARTRESLANLVGASLRPATAMQTPAQARVLPEDSAHAVVTDPPYYFSIPYADLSDMFVVWLKRFLHNLDLAYMRGLVTPKEQEATQRWPHSKSPSKKDTAHYELAIRDSMTVAHEVFRPDGAAVVVFAHASTQGWEALINGLTAAGWQITATWPIDTENTFRMLASRQRTLASSVHLICRPRENPDGSVRETDVGEWREIIAELPRRIHEWMPRLAEEGVVGADAILACIGPALEVFSRYSRVEKASGEVVKLGEFLKQIWAAVSKEALSMLFADADVSGLEPDARLTAMWLWTLGAGAGVKAATIKGASAAVADGDADDETADDGEDGSGKKAGDKPSAGYELEFDAARKIAQGLGAHLDKLSKVVEVKGDKARLLSVSERTRYLFGKDAEAAGTRGRGRRKKTPQLSLFAELEAAEQVAGGGWGGGGGPSLGATALDRVHQAMILFAAGRGEALKRFLVEDGAGTDARFWNWPNRCRPSTRPAPTRNGGSTACSAERKDWGYELRRIAGRTANFPLVETSLGIRDSRRIQVRLLRRLVS